MMKIKVKLLNKIRNLSKNKIACLLFLFSIVLFMICSKHQFNFYNNYSYLADSILKGRIDVPNMPEYLESVSFMGYKYMHFAPGVAWLSIPFVFIFGINKFNCIYLAMVLGALNSSLAYLILEEKKIGKRTIDRILLSLMLTIGTVHFFCATIGSSWFLGHVSTMFFILLSWYMMFKVVNKNNRKNNLYLFLSGLFFGLAVNCRLSALLGCVFLIYHIYKIYKFSLKPYLFFAGGAAIFGSIYMIYNYVRYGSIMDKGYNLTYLKDYHREAYDALKNAPVEEQKQLLKEYTSTYGGPLQLKYVKYNLYSIFMMAPKFSWEFPYIIPQISGTAITFTSPMLFAAVKAKRKDNYVIIL